MPRMTQFEVDAHNARQNASKFSGNKSLEAFDGLEAELHEQIEAELKKRRWYYVRSRMDRKTTTQKGVVDFIVAGNNGITYWLEIKRKNSKLTAEQTITKHVLLALGQRYETIFSFQQFLDFIDAPYFLSSPTIKP